MRSPITTHVLDTAHGRPAQGVEITIERRTDDGTFVELGRGTTNADGRASELIAPSALERGVYRIQFDTEAYYADLGQTCFYPRVAIEFTLANPSEHHHVPLLLSPYGFTTYRGS